MYVSPACIFVYRVCLLPIEAEEGLGFSGAGFTEDFETWDQNLGIGTPLQLPQLLHREVAHCLQRGKFYFFLLMKEENQGPGQFEWQKCVYWLADTQTVLIVWLR